MPELAATMKRGAENTGISRWRKSLAVALALFVAAIAATYYSSRVDGTVTQEDLVYIDLILKDYDPTLSLDHRPADFEAELDLIERIQKAALKVAPHDDPIPHGTTREPKDLYENRSGWCFDLGRTMQKALNAFGLETRVVAIYAPDEGISTFMTLITRGANSHSLFEVKTGGGWMVVEPEYPWHALDAANRPLSIDALQEDVAKRKIKYSARMGPPPIDIYRMPFFRIYGLYSRHGMFYPPFVPVPDIDWGQIWDNLSEAF